MFLSESLSEKEKNGLMKQRQKEASACFLFRKAGPAGLPGKRRPEKGCIPAMEPTCSVADHVNR